MGQTTNRVIKCACFQAAHFYVRSIIRRAGYVEPPTAYPRQGRLIPAENRCLVFDKCGTHAFHRMRRNDQLIRDVVLVSPASEHEENIRDLGDIEIPKDDRALPFYENASDEVGHCLLFEYYRQYLDDTGVICSDAIESASATDLHFLVASGSTLFATSDTPVCLCEGERGGMIDFFRFLPASSW